MKRIAIHNDYNRIQKRRAARMPTQVKEGNIKKLLSVLGVILFLALLHIQIQIHISQTATLLASSQEDFLQLQNIERDLTRQVAELKNPSRIHRIATAMGMIAPQDQRLAKIYSAPWINLDLNKPIDPALRMVNGEKGLSVWARLLSFGTLAEAKSTESKYID